MGILQIANHMVCSTLRIFLFKKKIPQEFIYIKYVQISRCTYCIEKKQICISLPFLSNKTWKYRWRIWRRGIDLPKSFHGLQPALQSPLTHRNSMVIYFFFPMNSNHESQWNERKAFSSLIEEHQRRKRDTRKMTTMKRKLKWFYWTGCIPSHLLYEVITISHITTHD